MRQEQQPLPGESGSLDGTSPFPVPRGLAERPRFPCRRGLARSAVALGPGDGAPRPADL